MQLISLFSGVGGFEYAAELMGWKVVSSCEINPFGRSVLKYYWPDAFHHDNVKTIDYNIINKLLNKNEPTILVAGFPCQPFSAAGKRLGTEDDRYGWPDCLRAIREVRPEWCLFENVRGLTNWNGGLVFDQVQADLENEGYEVTPFLLPACAVNAPHRRDRIWFVAYSSIIRCRGGCNNWKERHLQGNIRFTKEDQSEWNRRQCGTGKVGSVTSDTTNTRIEGMRPERENEIHGSGIVTDTKRESSKWVRSEQCEYSEQEQRKFGRNCSEMGYTRNVADTDGIRLRGESDGIGKSGFFSQESQRNYWANFPTQSPVCQRNDGISNRLARYITKELYNEISNTSKENRIENLPEMWKHIQQEEVWQKVRRFYALESKDILFQTMQLYQTGNDPQIQLSPFSEKFSKETMRYLQKHREFRRSPQGRKLEKQRPEKLGNIVSFLPHEIALAARRFEAATSKFETWHRQESIKAYGNAVVPQLVLQIFKAIEKYNNL